MTHSSGKPNILFLITDQHRPDHVGFGGNQVVCTPHLDSIAARGTVFRQAYVASPICMPNRASIMTGRMPSVHGTRFNGISLDWRANTFVRSLRQAGYRTTHIGKSHLQTMGVSRQRLRAILDYTLEEEALLPGAEDGWDERENIARYDGGQVEEEADFYGFERAAFAILHGDQVTGHYEGWLRRQGGDPDRLCGPANALKTYPGWSQVYQTALPAELHPSSYVATRTIDEIRAAASEDRPFFIHASWPDPHHPYAPPGEYYERHSPADMRLPESFHDGHTHSMPHYKHMIANRGRMMYHGVDGWAPTEEQYRHALAAEYGSIELIDDCVGRILRSLQETGIADNTIVVFTSDHGDMFGDHGIMFKHGMHYLGCLRVPLVITRPGQRHSVTDSLACSLDIGPTLLELAGVPPFHGIQGQSLVPILEDPSAETRQCVYIEEDNKFDLTGAGSNTRMRTLVSADGRLTVYRGHDHGELFGAPDALEMDNLFSTDRGRELRHHQMEQLVYQMMCHADESPRPKYNA